MSDCDEDGCQNYAAPGHQYCNWHESNPRKVSDMNDTNPGQGALVPLWDANRMGQECKRNAERRAAMGRNVPMDTIVKFAYECTLATMCKEYEAERATLTERIARLTEAADDAAIPASVREAMIATIEWQMAFIDATPFYGPNNREKDMARLELAMAWLREQGGES